MADVDLVAKTAFSYSTRRLQAGDTFTVPSNMARVLVGIGKAEHQRVPGKVKAPPASVTKKAASTTPQKADDVVELRAEYTKVVGKRPFNGWDADTLRKKIAEAK